MGQDAFADTGTSDETPQKYATLIGRTARRVASVAVAAVLLIALLNVGDIILRNGFETSLYGLNEINAYLVAIGAAACLPYGFHVGATLSITALSNRVGPNTRILMQLLSAYMISMFCLMLGWRIFDVASNMARSNQTTIMTDISTAPFVFTMSAAVTIAGVIMAIKAIELLRKSIAAFGIGLPIAAGLLTAFVGYVAAVLLGFASSGVFHVLNPSNPLVLAVVVFLCMWVLIILTVPIGIAMGMAGIVGTAALLSSKLSLNVFGSEVTGFVLQDSLSVLPLFLLMGAFATVAGIGSDLYRFAYALVGHVRGGLAHASILACAAFGTLTGSSVATQMSIGRIALFEMRDRNYSTELSAGSIAAGGTLGQLIPPSSALILYAIMAEQSVGQLFIGAIFPGLLATALYMGAVMVWLWIFPKHAVPGPKSPTSELIKAAKQAWSVLALLGVVLGGIYMGFFTELEAGSVGAVGAFIIAVARGKINTASFWRTMADTTRTLAMMYSLIFGVTMLSFFFGISGVPDAFIAWVDTLNLSPMGVVIGLILCYLILGTAMDAMAMMVITIPIFVPLVETLGFDPIWWGVMTIMCVEAGMISPPFGLNIFVISALDPKIPISTIYKGCWPFFASAVVKIILLLLFPAIVTYLPTTM